MSDEKQETIEGIVAEMRSNEFDDPRFDKYALWAARRLAKDWADRIEAAARRAYDKIDRAVCSIEEVASCEIDDVRMAMDKTLGDYYE